MKSASFAVIALLLATIASAAGITGTVTNDTGASMTVTAYRTDDGTIGGTATTNASGTYSITTGGGQYRVTVRFLDRTLGLHIAESAISNLELMVFGGLIIFFLTVEPHGLARLWQIGKEKLRLWPFPH